MEEKAVLCNWDDSWSYWQLKAISVSTLPNWSNKSFLKEDPNEISLCLLQSCPCTALYTLLYTRSECTSSIGLDALRSCMIWTLISEESEPLVFLMFSGTCQSKLNAEIPRVIQVDYLVPYIFFSGLIE